jgi:hypothetical protein
VENFVLFLAQIVSMTIAVLLAFWIAHHVTVDGPSNQVLSIQG